MDYLSEDIKQTYVEEMKVIDDKLEDLLKQGGNDENLVDEKRKLQRLIWNYGIR